jgi:ATP-binding cassette subfamily B protein
MIAAGIVFLAIGSAAGLAYPQGMRILVDEALAARSVEVIDRTALLMTAVLAIQAVATALRYVLFTTAGERIVARIKKDLYASLLRQEIAFFDERRTGELQSRLASDTTVLQNALSVNVSMMLRNAVTIVGGLGLLFYTSPSLTALMMLVVPPIAFGAVFYGRRLRALSREVQDAVAKSADVAEESIGGIRTVRAFAAEAVEVLRYGRAVDSSYALASRRIRLGGIFMAFVGFLGFGAASLVLWIGGRQVVAGELGVGSLTSFLVYTLLVGVSLGALTDLYADFTKAAGAAERLFELLDRVPALAAGGEQPSSTAGAIAFEGVGFRYPARPDVAVLRGIDLVIAPGEVVALVGPSGAGKSTIAALLTRLYDPTEGRITLDGTPLTQLDAEWLRRHVGVVSQEPILFSTSIEENVRYGRSTATHDEVIAACRAANAHEFVSKFPEGYATNVGERGVQLSGGQKQRIAIARAILKDPRILVLDEATSALDAESEHLVKEALDRLAEGRTVLVIAHRLSTVRDADRVVVLDGGKVAESGKHDELVQKDGLYKRLVERQLAA